MISKYCHYGYLSDHWVSYCGYAAAFCAIKYEIAL